MRAAAGAALLAVLAPASAFAHARSVSYSSWRLDERGAEVRARVSALDATVLGPEPVERYVQERLSLSAGGERCPVEAGSARAVPAEAGWIARTWRVRCPPGPRRIRSDLFVDAIPWHAHFAGVRGPGVEREEVLGEAVREISLDAGERRGGDGFFAQGILHLLTGWDHLVFLLVLLLGAGSLRSLLASVTGFTLGHSITLAWAVLGGARTDTGAVEALVGFSIAVCAVENVWLAQDRRPAALPGLAVGAIAAVAVAAAVAKPDRLAIFAGLALLAGCYYALLGRTARPGAMRGAVAALFGLVHGLAFASGLDWLELPPARLAGAVVGFNLGIEAAQLALVALAWPLLRALGRLDPKGLIVHAASAAALAAGLGFGIGRAFV